MKTLSTFGRFIFGAAFIVYGIFHFIHPHHLAVTIGNTALAEGITYVILVFLILFGAAIFINVKARLASLLLALFLLVFILGIHLPAVLNGASWDDLLKDTALMGAALTYSGILKK